MRRKPRPRRCPHCRRLFKLTRAGALPAHTADVDGPGFPYDCPMYGTHAQPRAKKPARRKHLSPFVHTRCLRRRKPDVVGLWHNIGFVVTGNELTVTLGGALEDELQLQRPRFTITLCPKKIRAWRQATSASATTSSPMTLSPRTAASRAGSHEGRSAPWRTAP